MYMCYKNTFVLLRQKGRLKYVKRNQVWGHLCQNAVDRARGVQKAKITRQSNVFTIVYILTQLACPGGGEFDNFSVP